MYHLFVITVYFGVWEIKMPQKAFANATDPELSVLAVDLSVRGKHEGLVNITASSLPLDGCRRRFRSVSGATRAIQKFVERQALPVSEIVIECYPH